MKRRTALFLSTALALVGLGALGFALLRPTQRSTTAPTGARATLVAVPERRAAPRISGATLLPPPARLDLVSLRGTPLFIDVWASWCRPCKQEAPKLARLARAYAGRVQFVGIDTQDGRGAGRAFVRRYRLDFPHLFDPSTTLATKLGVYGIPTMILVDREGRIAATLVGKQGETRLRRLLRSLARA